VLEEPPHRRALGKLLTRAIHRDLHGARAC
jgi:hypothetical protein